MQSRIAIIGIIVEETQNVNQLNQVLHEYGQYIVGRMGIPYQKRGVHIISVAMEAPQDQINALSGKLGKIPGISSKTAYSQLVYENEGTD